ncbi:hypothetical protein [Gracilibacillus sp. Marseille-QA3620]
MDLFPRKRQEDGDGLWKRQEEGDGLDRLMFGPRPNKKETASAKPSQSSNQQIDIVKLMEHSDTLLNSVSELSPVLRKIPSFISKFISK